LDVVERLEMVTTAERRGFYAAFPPDKSEFATILIEMLELVRHGQLDGIWFAQN
jgi:hypothetical protein